MMLALLSMLAAEPAADWEAASVALGKGDLPGAEQALRSVLTAGAFDGDVYYNLGNVLYRQEKTGAAILAWRRAAELLPRDPDIEANLDFARRSLRDRLEVETPHPWFAPWQVALTPDEGQWLGCALLGTGLLLVGLRRRWPEVPLPAIGALLGVVGGVIAVGGVADGQLAPAAVVLGEEVSVTSDLGGGVTLFLLHEGAEVLSVQQAPGFVLVQLDDGRKGWLPADQVGLVDPYAVFP